MSKKLKVIRSDQKIERDSSRVICRQYIPGDDPARLKRIINRIRALSKQQTKALLTKTLDNFSDRHENIRQTLKRHFQEIVNYANQADSEFSDDQKLLIGTYFTMEYAIESAALFNPSIVPHPDQSQTKKGQLRFIMSLRAVGEGHISSLVFRSGTIDRDGSMEFDSISSFADTPTLNLDSEYDRRLFKKKLTEMNVCDEVTAHVLDQLPEYFDFNQLNEQIGRLNDQPQFDSKRQQECFTNMHRLANSNYHIDFQPNHSLSERVIFPISERERGGIEDARFVPFQDDDGEQVYYATYTAYDGKTIMPQLIETRDFKHFKISTLNGDAVQNKDLALFPRKIDGRFAMLSRQDGENNRIMFSENLHFWHDSEIIQEPQEPWEFIKIGNCGSPIETERGWLVLTHGVGPVRTYSIGAILLDRDDPTKLISRLEEPLLHPQEEERKGYVPNVVYTCGAIVHNGRLIIPYAMSDIRTGVARVGLDELLNAMKQIKEPTLA